MKGKRENIAKEAESKKGSELWSYASSHKTGANTNKCNVFVAEMIEAAGATLPHRYTIEISQLTEKKTASAIKFSMRI